MDAEEYRILRDNFPTLYESELVRQHIRAEEEAALVDAFRRHTGRDVGFDRLPFHDRAAGLAVIRNLREGR